MENTIDKKKVGEELLKARQRSGLTRKQLSEKTGVSQSVIQKYEDNVSRYSVHSFLSLCEVLGLDPYYAFDPEAWEEIREIVNFSAVFGDVPENPEDFQEYIYQNSTFESLIADFPTDTFLLELFKEKYSTETFRNIVLQTAKRVERKNLGLDPNDDQRLPRSTITSLKYPEKMIDMPDGHGKMTPRMYSTGEMLDANIRYLNETGKEKLFNSLCDLLKDPANLLKKPIDSEKEE